MKVVVVKSPKVLGFFLRKIFKIKKEEADFYQQTGLKL